MKKWNNLKLFLDDIRHPQDVASYCKSDLVPLYNESGWKVVRNYEEFVAWILENGLPDLISFDHDLAEVHYDPSTKKESFSYYPETGHDCAKWLVDFCMAEHSELPEFYVHSMNPVGAQNIITYLENYKKHEDTRDRTSTTEPQATDPI